MVRLCTPTKHSLEGGTSNSEHYESGGSGCNRISSKHGIDVGDIGRIKLGNNERFMEGLNKNILDKSSKVPQYLEGDLEHATWSARGICVPFKFNVSKGNVDTRVYASASLGNVHGMPSRAICEARHSRATTKFDS